MRFLDDHPRIRLTVLAVCLLIVVVGFAFIGYYDAATTASTVMPSGAALVNMPVGYHAVDEVALEAAQLPDNNWVIITQVDFTGERCLVWAREAAGWLRPLARECGQISLAGKQILRMYDSTMIVMQVMPDGQVSYMLQDSALYSFLNRLQMELDSLMYTIKRLAR